MTSMKTERLRIRLIQLCGMFGSDFEGERANAAMLASDLLRSQDLSWADVFTPAAAAPEPKHQPNLTARNKVRFCQDHCWRLTEWEDSFMESLSRRHKPYSTKQVTILNDIYYKIAWEDD